MCAHSEPISTLYQNRNFFFPVRHFLFPKPLEMLKKKVSKDVFAIFSPLASVVFFFLLLTLRRERGRPSSSSTTTFLPFNLIPGGGPGPPQKLLIEDAVCIAFRKLEVSSSPAVGWTASVASPPSPTPSAKKKEEILLQAATTWTIS